MLPNHAPLAVAEQFGTLRNSVSWSHRSRPRDAHLAETFTPCGALRRDSSRQTGDDFPELLQELRGYLGPEKPGQVVKAIPGQGSNVPITSLGSSGFSAQLAAQLGLPFAFASAFRARLSPCRGPGVSRAVPAKRNLAEAVFHGRRASHRGGIRCRRAASLHHASTALPPSHSQSTG